MKKLLVVLLALGSISAFAQNDKSSGNINPASYDNYLPLYNCIDKEGDKISLLVTEAALCGLEKGPITKGLVVLMDIMGPGAFAVGVSYENEKVIAKNKDVTFTIDSLNDDKGRITFDFEGEEEIIDLSCEAVYIHMDC